ncbi:hypothetical protein B0T26DRAFT_671326 [Lasiosphaeria miniovina]|uniref:Uncharacterized protein n=1 Tax=Lasiosphaeria miniovina TaxID=1954250 RepID=A0AA40EE75_9PEZI|nr:uncharacterized protein B0T26DRAFT_671326 [Lasiosphaeria miniovina]KAK0735142.1 hypothetical protein B0T26DRAFT_671326 [Lasiosphaeria miniovina]
MRAWVADHDIDDPENTQITYNFVNASNTIAGIIQTESPYYQATEATQSPGSFNTSSPYTGDPVFPDSSCKGTDLLCNIGWAAMMQSTTNVTIAGAGLYSWFDNYNEACVDTQNFQERMVYDDGNSGGFFLWNLVTIGSVEMISGPDTAITAKPNTQTSGHPFWSALAGYLDGANPVLLSCTDDDTSAACMTSSECDLTKSYATMADLNTASASFPNQCMNYYAIDTLGRVLNDTMADYSHVNNGYDEVFGHYQSYTKEMIPSMIQDYMAPSTSSNVQGGPGSQFFDCTVVGYDYKNVNEPQAASNINVPNPKDTISKSLPALNTLQNTILARQLDLYYGIWNGSLVDLI